MSLMSFIGTIFSILPWVLLIAAAFIIIFWKKTKFPEMLRKMKEKKELERQVRHEAQLEALKDMKPMLVEAYKQKEVAKMTATTADKIKRFSDNLGIKVNSDKIMSGFGGKNQQSPVDKIMGGQNQQDNTVDRIMGGQQPQQQYQQPVQQVRYRSRKEIRRLQQQQRQQKQQYQQQPQPQPQQPKQDAVSRILSSPPKNNPNRTFNFNISGKDYQARQREHEKKMQDLLR